MSAAKKLDLVQGTPEWLNARYDYVTGSQTPVILNLSRYQTPLELFEEKILRQELRSVAGKEIIFGRGHSAEKKAREYLKEKGLCYEPVVMVSHRYPDLLVSLDGLTSDGKRMFECKFVGTAVLEKIRQGEIPPDHRCQIQAGLLVSGAEVCDYFATDSEGDSHWIEIFPEPQYQADIAEAAKRFMDCVRTGTPPEAGERDFIAVEDERFKSLEALKAEMDRIEALYCDLKDELVKAYREKRRVQCGLVQIVTSIRKGNIDYQKVPSLRGIDLEKYRKPSTEVVTVRFKKGMK
jgi:putative phage-type endonuclease